MLDNQLLDKLKDIGLNEKEAALYAAGLELWESSIQELAKEANIKRPTAYRIMEELQAKGLFSKASKGKRDYYEAEDPETIFGLYKIRQDAFARLLPDLRLLYNKGEKRPKVKFYNGIEGLKSMYWESLESKGTILVYGSIDDMWVLSKDFVHDYVQERIKRKILIRGIVPATAQSREYMKLNPKEMRELCLVPKERFPFTNEINIYNNKVAIFSFREQVGVIIESADIAHTQKAIFELAWAGAHIL
jgi:HTH-type transcriptional regulator, sugar sensing transcriptional regulator